MGTDSSVKKSQKSDMGKTSGEPEIEYWQTAFSAVVAVLSADLGNMEGQDGIIELFACSFSNVFSPMNN